MNAGTQAILIRYSLRELGGLQEREMDAADSAFSNLRAAADTSFRV